jgi:hypothetical protein
MLVITALFASMLSQYAQGGRIAYVAVKTDKVTYINGENVTFKLTPLTSGVYFSTSGLDPNYYWYNPGANLGTVHIIRIPDGYDPDQVINDKKMLDKIQSWDDRDMAVGFDYFNSTDGTKSLSWNGTVMQNNYDDLGHLSVIYRKALGGYYLIYPQFTSLAGHPVKFQLDRNAIFYLDALRVTTVPSIEGTTLTYNMTVSAPSSFTGDTHCEMSWSVNGNTGQEGNGSDTNHAAFDVVPGGSRNISFQQQVTVYSGYESFRLAGWIDTSQGNYTFQKTDWWINGRWSNDQPYYL